MKLHALCLCALVSTCLCLAREEPHSLEQSISVLRQSKSMCPARCTSNAIHTCDRPYFDHFQTLASKQGIESLLTDPNPVTRAYAWEAFRHRFPQDFEKAVIPVFADQAAVHIYRGFWQCEIEPPVTLGELLFSSFLAHFPINSSSFSDPERSIRTLPAGLREEILEVLFQIDLPPIKEPTKPKRTPLLGPTILTAEELHYVRLPSNDHLKYVLKHWEIPPFYQDRLRDWVAAGIFEALPHLARHASEEDLALFLGNLENNAALPFVLEAIQEWPHVRFLPALLDFHGKMVKSNPWWAPHERLLKAMFVYRSLRLVNYWQDFLTHHYQHTPEQRMHLKVLMEVITSNDDHMAYYTETLLSVSRTGKLINQDMLAFLRTERPDQFLGLAAWFIAETKLLDDLHGKTHPLEEGRTLLNQLKLAGTIESLALIHQQLSQAGSGHFSHALKAAQPFYDPLTFDVVVHRLRDEKNHSHIQAGLKALQHLDPSRAEEAIDGLTSLNPAIALAIDR